MRRVFTPLRQTVLMVEVRYQDRLGNNLFQYCFARILAEELGLALRADPIPGFPRTRERVDGLTVEEGPAELLHGQRVAFHETLGDKTPRRIVVDGHFQRYEYYAPYKERIRTDWLVPAPQAVGPPHPDDLVLHVRRGDYVMNKWVLPVEFYLGIAEQRRFRNLVIVTDEPNDPFFWNFKRFRPRFVRGTPLEDFWFLMHARRLVISPSSFSWWAAFLSKAEEIVFPVATFGAWTLPGLDLRIPDESRYTYVDCNTTYRMNSPEKLYFYWFMAKRCSDPRRVRRVIRRTLASACRFACDS